MSDVTPFLKVEDLSAGYGDVTVLWQIDFDVRPGEIVCIVGSNGAGKTTLLRTISGMVKARRGSITLGGKDITNAGPDKVLRAGVAHVPEGRRLFKGLSVRDNLLLGAYLREDRADVARDLDHMLELFPRLGERLNQDATTMSGGEQQMCAIARGLMSRPELLMIDELSLGLAPHLVERLGDALKAINKEGLAILLVEQDVMTAFDLADRGFVIETGRVASGGDTEVLVNDPAIRKAYLGV
ncbi:branched-chain amino acid ABC transporter ATP-binding protein [Acuticoccus sediminis]|uniref:Branched-chain amino acid ABC transporter ATP-binding protein n=1 Tax=Acuticoccus sediminis TaxID=2184697 RepID=A0A8B2P4N9_9HYPH|nr:ABC transporter ATP-binding protein [Acuticoccus sediminis]RAI03549.1 branched-chain amino acid ABC transporter ATP-binding protein [Acuticoccus sediminis]